MLISVINLSTIPDQEVQAVLRVINRQIRDDFAPYWHWSAMLRLEGRVNPNPVAANGHPEELRGDAILYLWGGAASEAALGYHDSNYAGLPFGIVFTEISKQLGEDWSVTLSHEALELVGDANVNSFALGPHPMEPERTVFHWYEMCDAVQAESYDIDGVRVSNFVLPLYFTNDDEVGGRNDFLGTVTKKKTLRSFGVNPGGYIGFFDPELQDHDTFALNQKAIDRMRIKQGMGLGRRSVRYRTACEQTKRGVPGELVTGHARMQATSTGGGRRAALAGTGGAQSGAAKATTVLTPEGRRPVTGTVPLHGGTTGRGASRSARANPTPR